MVSKTIRVFWCALYAVLAGEPLLLNAFNVRTDYQRFCENPTNQSKDNTEN